MPNPKALSKKALRYISDMFSDKSKPEELTLAEAAVFMENIESETKPRQHPLDREVVAWFLATNKLKPMSAKQMLALDQKRLKAKVSQLHFGRFVRLQRSGRVNMAHVSMVAKLAPMDESVVRVILEKYEQLEAIYPNAGGK